MYIIILIASSKILPLLGISFPREKGERRNIHTYIPDRSHSLTNYRNSPSSYTPPRIGAIFFSRLLAGIRGGKKRPSLPLGAYLATWWGRTGWNGLNNVNYPAKRVGGPYISVSSGPRENRREPWTVRVRRRGRARGWEERSEVVGRRDGAVGAREREIRWPS